MEWNTFDIFDSAGILVASATTTGASGSEDFCLPDDCYSYTVGGGSWQGEVSWALIDASGNVAVGGALKLVALLLVVVSVPFLVVQIRQRLTLIL